MEGDEANVGRQRRLNITTIYTLAFTGKTQVADEDENFTMYVHTYGKIATS